MPEPLRVGVVGCGAISGAYLLGARQFPQIQVVALADLDRAAAEAKAREFRISTTCSVEQLLSDQSVELVLNLTVPRAHAAIALAALAAGKHTYSEKPLGTMREEGVQILASAKAGGLQVGCAPDTFMGYGIQTARKAIDDGLIGRPIAFTAFMMGPGHESWHSNPQFFYEPGGGPMFDMGPYYLTALFNFFGPLRRITGAATIAIPRRTITSRPRSGDAIEVKTPDHICGTIEFRNGVLGTIITSFATRFPTYDDRWPITIFGTEGTLRVPDPNLFDGSVQLRRASEEEWSEVTSGFPRGLARSVGLADMAEAIRAGRPHRASAEMALAVLDAMAGFLESASSARAYEPQFDFERPDPMPQNVGT